jgi:death-on-curing protein
MADPRPIVYLTAGEIIAFNREILRRAGQPSALLRERGLLESAVHRPQDAAYYAGADMVSQAALYMVGIALNHPIVDGNKRTGLIAGLTFLRQNEYIDVDASLNDARPGVWLEEVVNQKMTSDEFAKRLSEHLRGQLTQPSS